MCDCLVVKQFMKARVAGLYCFSSAPNLDSQAGVFKSAFEGKGMWLVFDVKDVDAEYKRFQSMGVPIEVALRNEPWGDRHWSPLPSLRFVRDRRYANRLLQATARASSKKFE